MADVRAFRGFEYRQPQLEKLLAPPYDVVPAEEVGRWHDLDPWNVSRFTLPQGDYEGAARALGEAIAQGVLVQQQPTMYLYEVEFGSRVRRDLIAAVRLQPFEEGAVLPHERTHRGPKEDRLALLRATRAALEPLWFVHEAQLPPPPEGAPSVEFEWGGARHRLWRIQDSDWHRQVTDRFAQRPLLIADGHHRYETTLAFSQELGGPEDASSRFTLALLSSLADPGLEVLPTHRVMVSGVRVTGGRAMESLDQVLSAVEGRVAAGHYDGERFQVLEFEGDLALIELHRQVIDNVLGKKPAEGNVLYTRDAGEAVAWVDEGRGVQAFLLPRPDLRQVLALAREGKTLPQKSTYFYPKPPSGMVLHRLDPSSPL